MSIFDWVWSSVMLLTVTHYCRDTTWSSSPSQSRTCSVELSSPSTLSGLKGEVWHQISSVELTADQLTKSVYNTESEVLLMPALLDHKGISNTSELILDLDCSLLYQVCLSIFYMQCSGGNTSGVSEERCAVQSPAWWLSSWAPQSTTSSSSTWTGSSSSSPPSSSRQTAAGRILR